jgi:hypothetical protein
MSYHLIMLRTRRRPPLNGWWLVLDRIILVLSVAIVILALFGLFRCDELPHWWPLTVFVLVLISFPIRQLVELHRRRLANACRPEQP